MDKTCDLLSKMKVTQKNKWCQNAVFLSSLSFACMIWYFYKEKAFLSFVYL